MKQILLLFALGSLVSCAKVPTYTDIGDNFKPIVQEFYTLYGLPVPDLVVTTADLTDAAAICNVFSNGQTKIKVDKSTWDKSCDAQRRGLIFHELGHCVLLREHIAADVISYMRPQLQACSFYEQNKAQLDLELFQ